MMQLEPMSVEEVKRGLVDLLIRFIGFCEEHNLRYYTAFGTLLGTVRHQGFIPWDDDIDLTMPRDDYEKMLSFKGMVTEFSIVDSTTPGYNNYYCKITDNNTFLKFDHFEKNAEMGLFLDVFPMDIVYVKEEDVTKIKLKRKYFVKMLSYSLMSKYWKSNSIIKDMAKFPMFFYAKVRGSSFWLNQMDRAINVLANKHVGKQRYIFEEQLMSVKYFDMVELKQFESVSVCCPYEYDRYLTEMYGDYMKLPPKNKQVTDHDHTVFRKKHSA